MEVSVAFQQMVILFFGIILGYVAAKAKVIDEAGSKTITNLVMNIILPFFIISSGANGSHAIGGIEMLAFFLLSLLCYAIAYLVGFVITKTPLVASDERRIYRFMTTFGNTGFIGLPVIGALFGPDGVLYATIFNLPFNFLVFSIGIVLVSDDATLKSIPPRSLLNNCLIASVLAILLYLVDPPIPPLALECMEQMGIATVPLAMLITGASLAREPLRMVFRRPSLYIVALAKTLLVPTIAFFVLSLADLNIELVRVGTILMAMPVATNATLLCIQYGGPDRTASRGVLLSTSLSLITIPLIVRIIG